MTEFQHFSKWDYIVFAAMLMLSIIIGIYSALTGGRQSTADEILLGNRQLNPIAVGLSMMASAVSAIAILGIPSEIYIYNTMIGWLIVSYIPATAFIGLLVMTVYSKIKITSINEVLTLSAIGNH